MNNQVESLTYYAATKKYDLRFPTLKEDLDVDVVIIGGGFQGSTRHSSCVKKVLPILLSWRGVT